MTQGNKQTRAALAFGRIVVTSLGLVAATTAPSWAQAPQSDQQSGKGAGMGGMGHDMGGMGGMGGMSHDGGGGMGGMSHDGGAMGGMGQGGAGGGMMGGMGGMSHGGSGGGMGGGMMRNMLCGVTEHVEGRLAYLKAELKLTDEQQAKWNGFADAYRATTQKTAKTCAAMDASSSEHASSTEHAKHHGVLAQLAMMEKHMADHLDSVRGLKAAIEPLYAVLTEEQKKIADQALEQVMDVGMPKMSH